MGGQTSSPIDKSRAVCVGWAVLPLGRFLGQLVVLPLFRPRKAVARGRGADETSPVGVASLHPDVLHVCGVHRVAFHMPPLLSPPNVTTLPSGSWALQARSTQKG